MRKRKKLRTPRSISIIYFYFIHFFFVSSHLFLELLMHVLLATHLPFPISTSLPSPGPVAAAGSGLLRSMICRLRRTGNPRFVGWHLTICPLSRPRLAVAGDGRGRRARRAARAASRLVCGAAVGRLLWLPWWWCSCCHLADVWFFIATAVLVNRGEGNKTRPCVRWGRRWVRSAFCYVGNYHVNLRRCLSSASNHGVNMP